MRIRSIASLTATMATTALAFAATPTFAADQLAFTPLAGVDTDAEIVEATPDGQLLLSTNPSDSAIEFTDISDPSHPEQVASLGTGGGLTSVTITPDGKYALAASQTSRSQDTDELLVVDLAERAIVRRIAIPNGPDSIAMAPSGKYAGIAIENEGDGQGSIAVVDLRNPDFDYWKVHDVALDPADPNFLNSDDLQPEYIDFAPDDTLASTLQENNAMVLVDPAKAVADAPDAITKTFSTGYFDGLTDVSKGSLIDFTAPLTSPREPDGVAWTTDGQHMVTANEGENSPSGRTITVFDRQGNLVKEVDVERDAADRGWYNTDRASSRSVEIEGIEATRIGGRELIIAASERSNFLGVYDAVDPADPKPIQFLGSGRRPEDVIAIPSRNLIVGANEEGEPGLSIYRAIDASTASADHPEIVADQLPWGAIAGIGAAGPSSLYAVPQVGGAPAGQALDPDASRPEVPQILRIQPAGATAKVLARTMITNADGYVPSFRLADVAADGAGGFWVVRESDGALLHTTAAGRIDRELPVTLDDQATGLALSADGRTAWVSSASAIATVTLADGSATLHPFTATVDGEGLVDLATAPDGGLAGLQADANQGGGATGTLLRLAATGADGSPVTVQAIVATLPVPAIVPFRGPSGLAIGGDGSAWTTHYAYSENPNDTRLQRVGKPFAQPIVDPGPLGALPGATPAKLDVPSAQSVTKVGGSYYVTGAFNAVDTVASHGSVLVDDATGTPVALPAVDGTIRTAVPDGNGGYYVGGSFSTIGGLPRTNVARVGRNGKVYEPFDAHLDGQIMALTKVGSTLYVGTESNMVVNGTTRHGLAALNATSGALRDTPDDLVGPYGYPGSVYALAPAPNNGVYVGGNLAGVTGTPRFGILRMTSGLAIVKGFDAGMTEGHFVDTIKISGGRVYIAGYVGVGSLAGALALDGTTGKPVPGFDTGIDQEFQDAIDVEGDKLYVAGYRTDAEPDRTLRVYSATTGAELPTRFDARISSAQAIEATPDAVYVSGYSVTQAGAPYRDSVAKFDAQTGRIDAGWQLQARMTYGFLPIDDDHLIAYGDFATAGTVRGGVARYDATTLKLDRDFHPADYRGGTVLARSANRIYQAPSQELIAIDPATGEQDEGFTPDVDSAVESAVLADGKLIVAGRFRSVDGVARNRVAALDPDTGRLIRSFKPDANGEVLSVAKTADGKLVLGGLFTKVGGVVTSGVAVIDATTGAPLPGFAAQVATPATTPVRLVAPTPAGIVVAGSFTTIGGQARSGLARLDAATGAVQAYDPAPQGGEVTALALGGDALLVGGTFSHIGGADRAGLAALTPDGTADPAWAPALGGGSVDEIRTLGSTVTVAGSFTSVNGSPATAGLAVFGPQAPANLVKPKITGTPAVGRPLTCDAGSWSGAPTTYTFGWTRGSATITGAKAATYTPVAADAGQALKCRVSAANAQGATPNVYSPAVAVTAAAG